jgi:hypothetical protein
LNAQLRAVRMCTTGAGAHVIEIDQVVLMVVFARDARDSATTFHQVRARSDWDGRQVVG